MNKYNNLLNLNQVDPFNIYKSYFSRDISKLKIVEGEDIMKYYLEDNYHSINGNKFGTLWNSCMRQKEKNIFMKLYSDNPDSVKMLVYFSDDDKIRARALLWYGVKSHKDTLKEYNFMDRIYYVYDHDINFMKDWAKDNGFISKWEQNAKSELFYDTWKDKPIKKYLYVTLENSQQDYYPYLDTFKFFNKDKKRFSNSDSYNFDYVLVHSNGLIEREEELDDDWDDVEWPEDEMIDFGIDYERLDNNVITRLRAMIQGPEGDMPQGPEDMIQGPDN